MRYFVLSGMLLLAPKLALAHAILLRSQPGDQAVIPAGEQALVLRFDSRIDQKLSRLVLRGTNAEMVLPLEPKSSPDALSAKADLSPGSYVIHWQVLAVDGHMTRGDIRFTVK